MNVVQLDDRRAPHAQRVQRLQKMAFPIPQDLDAVRHQLRRCHRDPALRAQILVLMKAQVA